MSTKQTETKMGSDNSHSTAKQVQNERKEEQESMHERLVKDQGGFVEMKETMQKAAEEAGTNFDSLVSETKRNAEATLEDIKDIASAAKEKTEKAGSDIAQETKKNVEEASNRASGMADQIGKEAEDITDKTEETGGSLVNAVKEQFQNMREAIKGDSISSGHQQEDEANDPENVETEKQDRNTGIMESIKEEIQKASNSIMRSSRSDKK